MNRLKELRTQQDLSVRKLAAKAGVDPSAVSLLENDRRRAQLTTLTKLATALGVAPEELTSLQDTSAVQRGRASQRKQAEKKRQQSQTPTNSAAPPTPPRPGRRHHQPKGDYWVFDDEGTSYGPFAEAKARTLQSKLNNAYLCRAASLSEAGEQYRRDLLTRARGHHPAGFQHHHPAQNPPEIAARKPPGTRNAPRKHQD
jgi:transcriptional regulator with XRE-family HTH domain